MADIDFLDQLANLTPSAALSIDLVITGVTVNAVAAALVLGRQFRWLTPSQRRDVIKLVAALFRSRRRDQ